MTNHQTLATWDHGGASYSVSVHLENGKPVEIIIEETIGDESRCVAAPAGGASLDELARAWSTSRSIPVLSHWAKQLLDLAEKL